MRRPNILGMVHTRAGIDEHLNKVLVLLTSSPGHITVNPEDSDELVRAHLHAVRSALIRFEVACYA